VNELLEATAIARLVAEERRGLDQRIEPELLAEFGRRLDAGGADAVLDALRPAFSNATTTLQSALQMVGVPDDPATFLEHASPDELRAWQSIRPAVAELDTISAIARIFGPGGAFPAVPDPRSVDPALRCGWLHDTATMCTDSPLLQSCAEFQKPSPAGDVRSSPWLKVSAHLHSVDSARERLRVWAEAAWADEEAQHPRGGRLINGIIVDDPARPNPFTREEAG
jgi:hypothetical protein